MIEIYATSTQQIHAIERERVIALGRSSFNPIASRKNKILGAVRRKASADARLPLAGGDTGASLLAQASQAPPGQSRLRRGQFRLRRANNRCLQNADENLVVRQRDLNQISDQVRDDGLNSTEDRNGSTTCVHQTLA